MCDWSNVDGDHGFVRTGMVATQLEVELTNI